MADKKPFEDQIFNSFYSMFKSIGITPSIPQMEALRDQSKRLSVTIDAHIRLQVIEKVEALQQAIVPAFRAMERRIDEELGATKSVPTPPKRKKVPRKKKAESLEERQMKEDNSP